MKPKKPDRKQPAQFDRKNWVVRSPLTDAQVKLGQAVAKRHGLTMPKKPDRFERVVLAELKRQDGDGDPCIWLNGPDVVKLLRKEHRWMVRMVEKEKRETRELINRIEPGHTAIVDGLEARMAQCEEIRFHLTRRAR